MFTTRSLPRRGALALATATLALTAVPAFGHTELVKSSPAGGAVVRSLPRVITLTFAEPIAKARSVTVTRAGTNHLVSFARNPKNAAQVKVRTKDDREGSYAVVWKVVGDDGHTITGTVRFRVTR